MSYKLTTPSRQFAVSRRTNHSWSNFEVYLSCFSSRPYVDFCQSLSLCSRGMWTLDTTGPDASGMLNDAPLLFPQMHYLTHLMLLVSKENDDGKAMLALKPKGSQSIEGSSSCVIESPC